MFKRKVKIKKEKKEKIIYPFSEIYCDINDFTGTKTFERFKMKPTDKILIFDDVIYKINLACAERLFKYDPDLDILKGWAKIKRKFSKKTLAIIQYEKGNTEPIDRTKAGEMILACFETPALLKAHVQSDHFKKMIRSLPNPKGGMHFGGSKWIVIGVVMIIIVAVVVMWLTGMLHGILPGV
jgi:hypothetical protein